jgi:hypothetical protein
LQVPAAYGFEQLIGKVLQERVVTQSSIALWDHKIIRRRAHAPHDGTAKIHDELFVFHAAKAG